MPSSSSLDALRARLLHPACLADYVRAAQADGVRFPDRADLRRQRCLLVLAAVLMFAGSSVVLSGGVFLIVAGLAFGTATAYAFAAFGLVMCAVWAVVFFSDGGLPGLRRLHRSLTRPGPQLYTTTALPAADTGTVSVFLHYATAGVDGAQRFGLRRFASGDTDAIARYHAELDAIARQAQRSWMDAVYAAHA